MKNQVQLITYVDRLTGGGIPQLNSLLTKELAGVFGGAHLLPFFYPIDGADAGFDPVDHTQVDPRLGTWDDLSELGSVVELMADLIVNHVSSQSPQFQDFSCNGSQSRYAGMFLTFDRVFSSGASEADLLRIYRPRPGLPLPIQLLQVAKRGCCGLRSLLNRSISTSLARWGKSILAQSLRSFTLPESALYVLTRLDTRLRNPEQAAS